MQILLASQSRYRRELMDRLQLSYSAESPMVDEELLKKTAPKDLSSLPLYLAQKKAESLIFKNPTGITIGCDQMAFIDQQRLDKPGTKEKAIEQLLKLQGRSHTLKTAMSLHSHGTWIHHEDTTVLTFRPLTLQEIKNYVEMDEPLDCAGSYKIEKRGISLVEKIETQDFTAIPGLPLIALCRALRTLGIAI